MIFKCIQDTAHGPVVVFLEGGQVRELTPPELGGRLEALRELGMERTEEEWAMRALLNHLGRSAGTIGDLQEAIRKAGGCDANPTG